MMRVRHSGSLGSQLPLIQTLSLLTCSGPVHQFHCLFKIGGVRGDGEGNEMARDALVPDGCLAHLVWV